MDMQWSNEDRTYPYIRDYFDRKQLRALDVESREELKSCDSPKGKERVAAAALVSLLSNHQPEPIPEPADTGERFVQDVARTLTDTSASVGPAMLANQQPEEDVNISNLYLPTDDPHEIELQTEAYKNELRTRDARGFDRIVRRQPIVMSNKQLRHYQFISRRARDQYEKERYQALLNANEEQSAQQPPLQLEQVD